MFTASDLRKGLKIELDGEPYVVTDFDFCKPGKGQALYRCKLKHMLTGATMDRTFRSVDKIGKPDLFQREAIYSYLDGPVHIFMDAATYEEIRVPREVIESQEQFIVDEMECSILMYRERPVEVSLPTFIEKQIVRSEPGARGDTATNITKPAWLDNGYEVQVPLFVNAGDTIRLDTRTGEYSERVSKG